jgi:SET domain-containing protein
MDGFFRALGFIDMQHLIITCHMLDSANAWARRRTIELTMPNTNREKPYRVGRSSTGLGLFATKPIKKGTPIIPYVGPLLDSFKEEDVGITNKYLFEVSKQWTIDGSVRKNLARYINHACRPNAEPDIKPRKRKIVIRALRNIQEGEEINYHYGNDYYKAYLKPLGCKCVSCEKRRRKALEASSER